MSARRKQARPSRAQLDEELLVRGSSASGLQKPLQQEQEQQQRQRHQIDNIVKREDTREGNDSGSEGEDGGGVVGVGEEAVDLTASTRSHHGDDDDRDDRGGDELPMDEDYDDGVEEAVESLEDEEEEEGTRKQIRHRQDAENNNSFSEGGAPPTSGIFPPAGASHVTLEALQNTKVAVAQFAATALAGGADSEAALQDLALLQSTLYTLQHQQVFQLQLISQLQQQLSITHSQPSAAVGTNATNMEGSNPQDGVKEGSPSPSIHPKPLSALTSPPESRPPSHHQHTTSPCPSTPISMSQEIALPPSSGSPLGLPLQASTGINVPATVGIGVGNGGGNLGQGSNAVNQQSNGGNNHLSLSHQMPSLCSISSSLASTIITNTDPPPLHEPNTLEMLQKRAQEVLDNASQGLLANNLADELAFRSGKGSRLSPYDSKSGGGRGEPFFKHRCRYCGKVFGSDSALQIHIRSHTGERPFKCNVCGSRFTTKGNLKVHFQRHTAKFPHVKMNPNPIPEHLDKYHPPLLQQLAAPGQRQLASPPPSAPHHPPFHPAAAHGFLPPQPPLPLTLALPGMPPLYRAPVAVNHCRDSEQEVPENLSKPVGATISTPSPRSPVTHSNSHHSFHEHPVHPNPHQKHQQQTSTPPGGHELRLETARSPNTNQESPIDSSYRPARPTSQEDGVGDRVTPKREPDEAEETAEEEIDDYEETRRYLCASPQSTVNPTSQAQPYEDCSMDSKMSGRLEADGEMEGDEEMEEQPENLSSRGATGHRLPGHQTVGYLGASPASSSASSGSLQTSFAGILFPGPPSHHQLPHHQSSVGPATPTGPSGEMMVDPARDPAIYSSLLPRPGSNDNSWESLIEITKTSETSKLQQLVDNIEHKLTDPNQCVICHRVLSCKSALQMHYRTHTGERPFKCKICGRAFTTKGNLKTHMGVHRAKPPLRVLHQCPVCHKKFTNALVLQQHIRLHTGEPTDLSPEQIQAAEVNEFPSGYPHHPLASFLPQGFPSLHPSAGAGFALGFPPSRGQQHLGGTERHDNHIEGSKESRHHFHHHHHHMQHQQQQQQQERYLDEQGDDMDDQDDDDEGREDDDRCDEARERQSADGDEVNDDIHEEIERRRHSSAPLFSTSLAALENQVRTITTTCANTLTNNNPQTVAASPPVIHQYNGNDKTVSPSPCTATGAPLDLTPRASSTPADNTSTSTPNATPPPQIGSHHNQPPNPFGMFAGLLQAVSSPPSTSSMSSVSGVNSIANINTGSNPGSGAGSGPLASLTTSAVLAATSTYNPLGLAVGGPAGRRC